MRRMYLVYGISLAWSGLARILPKPEASSAGSHSQASAAALSEAPLEIRTLSPAGSGYLPELPNPFSARAESCNVSTSRTRPVRTGTGTICAIFSPACNSTACSPRLVIRTRISPRYPASITPPVVAIPRAAIDDRSRTSNPKGTPVPGSRASTATPSAPYGDPRNHRGRFKCKQVVPQILARMRNPGRPCPFRQLLYKQHDSDVRSGVADKRRGRAKAARALSAMSPPRAGHRQKW